MPLAEAITQLSFLEFLQRCNLSIAPPQPPQLPVPTLLCRRPHLVTSLRMCPRRRLISRSPRYLLTWQCRRLPTVLTPHLWMLPCRRSHTVLFLRTFLRRWVLAQLPRVLLTCLSRLPYAVRCYTMLPYNYRSRSSLLAVSSRTILWTAKTLFVSPCHQYKVHVPCCSHRQDSNSSLRLQVSLLVLHLYTTHGSSTTAAPLRARPRSAISVSPPQPPACTIHVGTHHARSATTGKRSAGTALAGTHNLAITDSRAGSVPFPKPRALVLLLVHFGQSKPEGHTGLDTVDSDLMHHQFRLSLLQWNPGPARKHPTCIVSAACGKFHAVILTGSQ